MAHLRAADGCPWDRAQTYDSLKALLLEEAYEVIDAVNARDFDALEDELGDLLFQVVFFSRLAEEERRFAIDDVIERVHAKLVRRHPHVFAGTRARTPEEALKSWNAVKEKERQARLYASRRPDPPTEGLQRTANSGPLTASLESSLETQSGGQSVLDGIPATLPSALEAYELGVRASEVGFDWEKIEDLLDKIEEELGELRRARIDQPLKSDGRRVEEEVGDLLFAAANLARKIGSDPESCLRRANQKFKQRFRILETEARKHGRRLDECTPQQLDSLWNTVKKAEP